MENTENITVQPLASVEQNVPTVDGLPAVEGAPSEEVLDIHVLLNRELGKDFKDDQSALKSIKDTFSYVGKAGKYLPLLEKLEQTKGGESEVLKIMENIIEPKVVAEAAPVAEAAAPQAADDKRYLTVEQVEDMLWLNANPEINANKKFLDALSTLPEYKGKTLKEVAASEDFQKIAGSAASASGRTQSVIHSNSRVAEIPRTEDYQTDFETAKSSGNWADFLTKYKGLDLQE